MKYGREEKKIKVKINELNMKKYIKVNAIYEACLRSRKHKNKHIKKIQRNILNRFHCMSKYICIE